MPDMPDEKQWEVMESVESTLNSLEKLRKQAVELYGSLSRFEEQTRRGIVKTIDRKEYGLIDIPGWYKSLRSFGTDAGSRISDLFLTIERSPLLLAHRRQAGRNGAEDPLENLVSAELFGTTLVVKTPNLLNRFCSYRQYNGTTVKRDHYSFFVPEVERKMEKIADRLPDILSKNIAIFSVYGPEKQQLPDAENLDTKEIIDAIMDHFRGSDGGKYCSLFQLCLQDDTLIPGAYFIVTEDRRSVPDYNDTLHLLKSRWQRNDIKANLS